MHKRECLATYPPDPLPLLREGGSEVGEGLRPSLKSLPPLLSTSRYYKESLREASPLLENHTPFPLSRGRGIKRDGVAIKPKGGEVNKQPNKQHFARVTNTDILNN
jgi:hypothetical protein